MYQRLLIPIEFGAATDALLRLAKKLAAPGAEARLVHVVTNETTLFFADMLSLDRFVERARAGLEKIKATAPPDSGLRIDTRIREGTIFKEILDEVAEWQPDVIVMGSHGRTGLGRMLLGSVAERVLRGTELPVCIVKGEVSDAPRFARIGLATDLEETMSEASDRFEGLLRDSGASGMVIHVFHAEHWLSMANVPAPFVESGYTGGVIPDTEIENQLQARRAEREKKLAELASDLRAEELDVSDRLLDGEPWTEIAELMESERCELLIVGTHRYKALDRFILGSVAEKTLRTVRCPVLVVPHTS